MKLITEREIDELGRIVLPFEIRTKLGISTKSTIGIYEDGDKIVLCKAEPSCKLCGKTEAVNGDLHICADCMEKVKNY
ncbi:MAG: AbrB/MazE/SpoVT family DNA-binding domain-containing protein [Eubacteriales bacterium]|nr:AbrB/MazE/SpoVT family DNA-binding domain-containing protein [Eubacteriales bacterium]